MHIPDGVLSPTVLVAGGILTVATLAISVKKANQELDRKTVPTMGVMAAFIFAAQMVNFPILGAAASGHLLGGALSAILFGFWPATLIMTVIVAIQALIFQDGGVSALGINLLNMAIIAPATAAIVYQFLKKVKISNSIAVFTAGFFSVMITAFIAALELGFSGVVSYLEAISALTFWHLFIGVTEGVITMIILPFALRSKFGEQKEANAR